MSADERHELRERWGLVLIQSRRVNDRAAWVDANPDHPLSAERNEALLRSARKLGAMGDELEAFAGMRAGELVGLLLEVERRGEKSDEE